LRQAKEKYVKQVNGSINSKSVNKIQDESY